LIKARSKKISMLLILAMMMTLFVGVGTASAASVNSVNKVLAISDDYDSAAAPAGPLGVNITIQEDSDFPNDFADGEIFELELCEGVKWVPAQTVITNSAATTVAAITKRTSRILEVTMPTGWTTDGIVNTITINPGIEVDGAQGDIYVTVNPLDSAVSSGDIVFATVSGDTCSVTVDSVKKIGKGSAKTAGTLTIRENAINAIGKSGSSGVPPASTTDNKLTLKLPSNFEWNTPTVTFGGGLQGSTVPAGGITGTGTRTLSIEFDTLGAVGGSRGSIYVVPSIDVTSEASNGEIEVNITGTKGVDNGSICDDDIVIANYVDYGVTTEIKEVKELKSGKFEEKTAKITIEENMAGALLANRDIHIEFPSWVKVTRVSNFNATNGGAGFNATAAPTITGKKSYIDITIAGTSTSKGKIELDVTLSTQANKFGEIEATISGAGATEETLVVAEVVQRASMETTPTDVRVGIQDQELADIIISEAVKEGFARSTKVSGAEATDGEITVTLTEGVRFSTTPDVEVIEGNVEVNNVAVSGGVLSMDVKSESTKPSQIKVSGIKVTLDRSVPEGSIYAKLGGSAVNENSKAALGWVNGSGAGGNTATVDEGEFDVATVQKVAIANVVTTAPGEITNQAGFVIGSATYILNGEEKEMDVAPYIKNSRTYMPVRYVAYALGIDDNNILWDGVNRTVTLMKGDKVVQMQIGSTTILINGAAVTMDVAPEITSDRTMLPARWVAQAFGASVGWDEATQTVSIN